MGTQDQGQPLANSYDFWFLDYLKGTCSKGCLEHLHYFHKGSCSLPSKYKSNFCRIPCKQRYKNPKTTTRILLGVHWPHQWRHQCWSHVHHMYWFYSVMRSMVPTSLFHHWNLCRRWWLQINLQITQRWERVCLLLFSWMMSPWNFTNQP